MTTNCDECSEEYGPCELHCEVLFQREGASLRTADELNLQFLNDAKSLVPDVLSPYGTEVVHRVAASLGGTQGWIHDDPNLADELYSVVDQVENNIGTAGYQTYRDDGYRIVRITGGPLQEES